SDLLFCFRVTPESAANESPKLRTALCAREHSVPSHCAPGRTPRQPESSAGMQKTLPFLKKVGHRQLDPCFSPWERQLPQPGVYTQNPIAGETAIFQREGK